jgi:hypothetical protein
MIRPKRECHALSLEKRCEFVEIAGGKGVLPLLSRYLVALKLAECAPERQHDLHSLPVHNQENIPIVLSPSGVQKLDNAKHNRAGITYKMKLVFSRLCIPAHNSINRVIHDNRNQGGGKLSQRVMLFKGLSTGVAECDMKRSEKLFYVTKRTDGTSCSIRSTLGDSAGR